VRVLVRREGVLVSVMAGVMLLAVPFVLVLVRGVSGPLLGVVVPVGGLVEWLDAVEVDDDRSEGRPIALRNLSFNAIISSNIVFLLWLSLLLGS